MAKEKRKIKVLVVDDSAVIRKLISSLLEKDPGITVVGTAMDGIFALSKLEQLRPDVITLDIDMPRADGLDTLRQIVTQYAIPVVMVSALAAEGTRAAIEALEIGAVDVVCKPTSSAQISGIAIELIGKIKAAASCRVTTDTGEMQAVNASGKVSLPPFTVRENLKIVAVGASSGGPHALRRWLPLLPADFPCPIVITQHLPPGFTATFARWLDELCQVTVREAQDGLLALPGSVLIAPGNSHLTIRKRAQKAEVALDYSGPINGFMPSVEVLFHSIAENFGSEAVAVLMTGMGSDGADAIGEIKNRGGLTLAQDEESCMIFGMPGTALRKGHIHQIVPLERMAEYLMAVAGMPVKAEVRSNAK